MVTGIVSLVAVGADVARQYDDDPEHASQTYKVPVGKTTIADAMPCPLTAPAERIAPSNALVYVLKGPILRLKSEHLLCTAANIYLWQ